LPPRFSSLLQELCHVRFAHQKRGFARRKAAKQAIWRREAMIKASSDGGLLDHLMKSQQTRGD
jgi:hypothetical protein